MSDAPISDEKYQQALDDVIDLMRGMNRAVSKMHPGDIGLPDVPAFDGQGRIDGGQMTDNTEGDA
jgi:hypothetical protein